jgi:hypothetical protein
VRAGARRTDGFRSGKDNGSLASLAAAAVGGVTIKTLCGCRLRKRHENDNCIGAATHENRMPICTYGLRQPATPQHAAQQKRL